MSKTALITPKKLGIIATIVLIFLIYIIVFIFLRDKIPDMSNLFSKVEEIYSRYGYYLIFFGALIEGTFLLGLYIPGSFIVLLGVSLARMGITSFPLVILYGTIGFCIGYILNYILGRYGWHTIIAGFGLKNQIEDTKTSLSHNYDKALFWGYMVSGTGAMISTASGILKIPFREFLIKTFLYQLFWSLVLGGLAYIFGITFIKMFVVYFGTIFFISMVLYIIKKSYKRKAHAYAKSH